MNESITITGRELIEHLRWVTIRSALRLEIRTGMKRSNRGRPTVVLANEISGCTSRSKKAAYEALDAKIVEAGVGTSKPL